MYTSLRRTLIGLRPYYNISRRRNSNMAFSVVNMAHENIRLELATVNVDEFVAEFNRNVDSWREQGKTAVWIEFGKENVHMIGSAMELGFEFHHAQGANANLMMWLPKHLQNKVPRFGFHQVGVGGFVLNDKHELLLIKERFMIANRWKLPGGLIDPGESLSQGVTREVFEETGVRAECISVMGFYQRILSHKLSDIYFVLKMKALTTELTPDPLEISDCKWEPIESYDRNHPLLKKIVDGFVDDSLKELELHPIPGLKGPLDAYFAIHNEKKG